MLEAATAGGKREVPGSRESLKTRGFRFCLKFPVDRSNAEKAEPTGKNRHGAKSKRWVAKWH
jgi:hypothetical protein